MTMTELPETPGDEDLSFYEDAMILESNPRPTLSLCEPLSAKKVAKQLFQYSEMTVDLPVWSEKDNISWENSSTESEQATLFTSAQRNRTLLADFPGYV